jgi:hypothetical protein
MLSVSCPGVYLRGEAAAAYPDPVERFDRHVLFVDPGLYLVYDDLAAPGAGSYDWLLHSHERPEIDGGDERSILAVCRVGQPGSADGPELPEVDLERTDGGIRVEGGGFSGEVTFSGSPSIGGAVRSEGAGKRIDLP